MIREMVLAGVVGLAGLAPGARADDGAVCEQRSDPRRTAALIELYTSQGCSSCPPADRWLSTVGRGDPLRVPLSLHVDYWDAIGWRDPYARPAFTLRQRWTAERNGTRTIYTPGVFADGAEWRDWHRGGDRRIGAINARAPQADIRLRYRADASAASLGRVEVDAEGAARSDALPARVPGTGTGTGAGRPALFVALTESGLANRVTAGENRGERLVHDHVARLWYGPVELTDGRAVLDEALPWPPATGPQGDAALVAFVQDLDSGRILQAIRMDLKACAVRR